MAANLDIASTVLDLAGLTAPPHLQGHSLRRLARGGSEPVRDRLLYEYYWERKILDPAHAEPREALSRELFALLAESGGMSIPLQPDLGARYNLRRPDGSSAASFPAALFAK